MQGTSAWQIRFEEGSDPSKSFHQIRINGSVYQLRFQGRAWISVDDYQILRLQTDLVAPIPQIHLQLEHLDIAYAPVEFDKPKLRIWLPESASIEITYRGHSYQRMHKFSHFQLFLVVTEQTIKEPGSRTRGLISGHHRITSCSLSVGAQSQRSGCQGSSVDLLRRPSGRLAA